MPETPWQRAVASEHSRLQLQHGIKCGQYASQNRDFCASPVPTRAEIAERIAESFPPEEVAEDGRRRECHQAASEDHIVAIARLLTQMEKGEPANLGLASDGESAIYKSLIAQDDFDRPVLLDLKRLRGIHLERYFDAFREMEAFLEQCLNSSGGTACESNGFGECRATSAFESDRPSWSAFGGEMELRSPSRNESHELLNEDGPLGQAVAPISSDERPPSLLANFFPNSIPNEIATEIFRAGISAAFDDANFYKELYGITEKQLLVHLANNTGRALGHFTPLRLLDQLLPPLFGYIGSVGAGLYYDLTVARNN